MEYAPLAGPVCELRVCVSRADRECNRLIYKRGCQEHFSPSARCRGFDLRHPADFGTLIWPHFGRLMWPHLIYSDRSSYPVPASRDGEGDGQETQGGTV